MTCIFWLEIEAVLRRKKLGNEREEWPGGMGGFIRVSED
jgi:hypothetical protein